MRQTIIKLIKITTEDLNHKKSKIIKNTNPQVSKKFSKNRSYVDSMTSF